VTLAGFAVLFVLPEPLRAPWARYADSVLVMVLALLFLPVPLGVLRRSAAELLHMASEDDAIAGRVEAEMRAICSEHDVRSHSTHVAKIGRSHLVEVNIVVGPRFSLQTVPAQDGLRERIWAAVDRPIHEAWLTINITADPDGHELPGEGTVTAMGKRRRFLPQSPRTRRARSAALGTDPAGVDEAQWPLRSVAGRLLAATRAVATVRLKIQEN